MHDETRRCCGSTPPEYDLLRTRGCCAHDEAVADLGTGVIEMLSRRFAAVVLAALATLVWVVHELHEVTPVHDLQLHSATLQAPAGASSNSSLSEFDAAVEYSSQIFARVSKGEALVSASSPPLGAVERTLLRRAYLTLSNVLLACTGLLTGAWQTRHSHDCCLAPSGIFAHVAQLHLGSKLCGRSRVHLHF